jgi:hypothetical protein
LALAAISGGRAQEVTTYLNNYNFPTGIVRDQQGNTYVALRGENRIIKVDLDGNVSTYCDQGLTLPVRLTCEEQEQIIAFLITMTDSSFLTDRAFSDPFVVE